MLARSAGMSWHLRWRSLFPAFPEFWDSLFQARGSTSGGIVVDVVVPHKPVQSSQVLSEHEPKSRLAGLTTATHALHTRPASQVSIPATPETTSVDCRMATQAEQLCKVSSLRGSTPMQ